jgi:hypothetical protein
MCRLPRRSYPNYGVATEQLNTGACLITSRQPLWSTRLKHKILSILVLCRRHYRFVKRYGCAAFPRRGYPNYGVTPTEHRKDVCLLIYKTEDIKKQLADNCSQYCGKNGRNKYGLIILRLFCKDFYAAIAKK